MTPAPSDDSSTREGGAPPGAGVAAVGERVGRYRLFRPIASGGMGTVYLGWLESDGGVTRPIAAKVMHAQGPAAERSTPMTLTEARIASRIRHPNVVSLTDVVTSIRGPVLILEYVAGDSLSHLLEASSHAVPWPVAVRIMVDVLEGLHAAHEATNESGLPLSVVHRDVSPHNVLVDEAGMAKIADFGVAKALERAYTTESGEVRGKLAYMAPEQLDGKAVDRRADVWGAGMVLWQMLAGARPFAGLDVGPTMKRIATGAVDEPTTVRDCPEALVRVCMRAVSADLDARYATARLMAIDLERALAPASHRDVARWVKRSAGSELAARAALVKEMESLALRERSDAVPRPAVPAPASSAPLASTISVGTARARPPVLRWAMLGTALLAIAASAVVAARGMRSYDPGVTSAAASSASSPAGPTAQAAPTSQPERPAPADPGLRAGIAASTRPTPRTWPPRPTPTASATATATAAAVPSAADTLGRNQRN